MKALIVTSVKTSCKPKNKFRNSTQWPIFVQAPHLTYLLHTEICTLPSHERHFKFRPHARTVLVQLGSGIVNGIIILWYMAVFIWLWVPACHTTHNNQRTMQVSLSAAWDSAGIVLVPFHILLGKALKLTQLPKCCNLAKQFRPHTRAANFMCCQLPSRLQVHWLCLFQLRNLSSLHFLLSSSFFPHLWLSVLQGLINSVNLKCIPNQTYFSSCCAHTTSDWLSVWQESETWRCLKQKLINR